MPRTINDLSVRKQTFDRHMTILFDYPSQSVIAFAGERRFSKSKALSASVSFLPLPPISVFGSHFISRAAKTGLSLLRNQMETLAMQANNELFVGTNETVHYIGVSLRLLRKNP